MKKGLIIVVMVLVAVLMVVPVSAQPDDIAPDEDPLFGTFQITNGFLPDPWIFTAIAGGLVDSTTLDLGPDCRGFINDRPDINMEWVTDSSGPVRIFFISDEDTTLIIRDPEGNFICNDDNDFGTPADGSPINLLSPGVEIETPIEGTYNIWVGTFRDRSIGAGYLMVTEFARTYPGQIVSPFLGVIVEPE